LHRFSIPLEGRVRTGNPNRCLDHISPDPDISNAMNAEGRLLVPLLLRHSCFNPPGMIDTAAGRVTRIPSENLSDYQSIGCTPDGHVIALKIAPRNDVEVPNHTALKYRYRPRR
jgi:hypothetical protein